MAEDAGGLAAFLSPGDDLARQAGMFRRKLIHPVAENLALTVSGVEVYDVEPKVLPNLFHGMPIRIYGRYRGEGTGKVALSGQVLGKALVSEAQLEFPRKDEDNPEIERMWARHRMETLQNSLGSGDDQAIIDEIIGLGEAYSITSEYTSFIVLENDAEYQRWNIEQRNQRRLARDRRNRERLRAEFDRIRTKAATDIGPEAAGASPSGEDESQLQPQPLLVAGAEKELPPELLITEADRQPPPRRRRQTFNFGGGGALDPLSALISLGLFCSGLLGLRRKKE